MPPSDPRTLPFLTREMLDFQQGVSFSIEVLSQSNKAQPISIVGMTKAGTFKLSHTPTSDSVISTETFRIPDIPITLAVFDETDSHNIGHTFIKVSLLANGDPLMTLCGGYVTKMHSLSYPTANNPDVILGGGQLARNNSADPAAGAECTITVPSRERWKIHNVTVTLVTDATAANRRPHLVFNANNLITIDCFSATDQTASLTRKYSFAPYGYLTAATDDNDILVPIPSDLWIEGGNTITTETTGIQAGDNYGIMYVNAEKFAQ